MEIGLPPRNGATPLVYQFKEQLQKGQQGEALFLQMYDGFLMKTDGRKSDFLTTSKVNPSRKLELKTDGWRVGGDPSHPKFTKNFFIERWSNFERQTPGGVWQAINNQSDTYAYLFVNDRALYLADTQRVVAAMDEVVEKYKLQLISIPNKNYTTKGYKTPIQEMVERKLFVRVPWDGDGPFDLNEHLEMVVR